MSERSPSEQSPTAGDQTAMTVPVSTRIVARLDELADAFNLNVAQTVNVALHTAIGRRVPLDLDADTVEQLEKVCASLDLPLNVTVALLIRSTLPDQDRARAGQTA